MGSRSSHSGATSEEEEEEDTVKYDVVDAAGHCQQGSSFDLTAGAQ